MSYCKCYPSSSYHNISGKLMYLPDCYRFWQPKLDDYYQVFDFMYSKDLMDQAARHRMTLDYQRSLFELHRPIGLFREQHFLMLGQISGFICEALLLDYLLAKCESADKKLIRKITKRPTFGILTQWLEHDIASKHNSFLDAMKEVRNSVHLKKANVGMRRMKSRYFEPLEYTTKTGKTRNIKVTRSEKNYS